MPEKTPPEADDLENAVTRAPNAGVRALVAVPPHSIRRGRLRFLAIHAGAPAVVSVRVSRVAQAIAIAPRSAAQGRAERLPRRERLS